MIPSLKRFDPDFINRVLEASKNEMEELMI